MYKYGFVYIWYDRKHKRYYIGCHWGTEVDGYISSSYWMKRSYKRRPGDFKRRILSRIYTNKKDLLEEEYKWIQMMKPEELKVRYYNLHNHKFNHWSSDINLRSTVSKKLKETHKKLGRSGTNHPMYGKKHSLEAKQKMSKAHKGFKHSEESKAKISETTKGEKNHYYGKKHSKEVREKMKKAHLGTPLTEEHKEKIRLSHLGEKNHYYGKKHSKEVREKLRYPKTEEHKEKLRQANLGKTLSAEAREKCRLASKKYWENRSNG